MVVPKPLHEALRNRLLRRADWRFLLPNPMPTKTISFVTGFLAEAVSFISGRTIDGNHQDATDCDLAVAIDPDYGTLKKAWEALKPGASLYTEWYSVRAGGPEGIGQRLQAAGFEQMTCYWPWPWPGHFRTQFWLPLDAPMVIDHFKKNRFRVRAFMGRIGYGLRQVPWILCLRMGIHVPVCVAARKASSPLSIQPVVPKVPAPRNTPRMAKEPDLSNLIRSEWTNWGMGSPPKDLSWLLLTGGPRSISKVVGLVFADQEVRPRMAVKWSRVPEAVPALAREAAALQAVHSRYPDGMQGVPRVLFCHERAGLITLGETALTGQPLWTILHQDNYRDIALKATSWMVQLVGKAESCPRAIWWERLVQPVFEDFCESFGPILDRGMVRETERVLNALNALPLLCEHRDFSPWNVLTTHTGDLVVLDWESAELDGLPAMDLIYFLTYLAFYQSGAMKTRRFRKAYRSSLNPSSLTGSVMHECLERYLIHAGVETTALRPLRLLTWMLHSRSEYKHFVADAAGKPERRALLRSLFVSLWEEELRYAAGLVPRVQ